MATVETLEWRTERSISAADSAGEEWDNTSYVRKNYKNLIKKYSLLYFGNVVEKFPFVIRKKEYIRVPERPFKDNPFLVELGGRFEQVGGNDEAVGGGDQKMGSSN